MVLYIWSSLTFKKYFTSYHSFILNRSEVTRDYTSLLVYTLNIRCMMPVLIAFVLLSHLRHSYLSFKATTVLQLLANSVENLTTASEV